MALLKKTRRSNTDTEVVRRNTEGGPSRKRRRMSTMSKKDGEDGKNKPNKSSNRSFQPKKLHLKTHREKNVRFTKFSKSRVAKAKEGSIESDSDVDVGSSDGANDRIEGKTDHDPMTTQIRTVFQCLLDALDGRSGMKGAHEQYSAEGDDALDKLQRRAPSFSESGAAVEQTDTGAHRDLHLDKGNNTSELTNTQQSLNTSHLIVQTSTQTTAPDDKHNSELRHKQNARVAAIVQWAQHTRTYNSNAAFVHPFNLPPPTQTHPLSLAQLEFIRPTVEPSPSFHPSAPAPAPAPFSPPGGWSTGDMTALYECHPAYAHLTPEQRIQVQHLVEKGRGKTVLERRFEVVEAELSLNRARMWGDEEAKKEKRGVLECLGEEAESFL